MTYRELRERLASLTKDQLDLPAQVHAYGETTSGCVHELRPVYALGTVGEMMGEDEVVRCNRDGGNNRDSLVLFADLCIYDEHGETPYDLNDDGSVTGVKTGVVVESPFPAELGGEG